MPGDDLQMYLEDTKSGEKEPFEPLSQPVLMYVCGLTVSDDPHLGHARTWISFDVLHRYLEHLGHEVRHVENVTDVDDKIIAKADEEDSTPQEVAEEYAAQVFEDMRDLNLRRVDVRPHVTEHVDDIVDIVERLVERGYAYETDDGVYFDVGEFDGYGELSGQKLEELESQGEESDAKRDPADFALWKPAKEGEPSWTSPWGDGRPGWHVECSAMSTRHLGDTIDVHGGGRDLVFPHHENEIAQTEAATGEEFARYWLHVGALQVEGDKMSTSLDNFWTVHDALDEYTANELRAYLISTHYRKPQSFTEDSLEEGANRWRRIRDAVDVCRRKMDSHDARAKHVDDDLRDAVEDAREGFEEAMSDDLNTPEALASLYGLVDELHDHADGDVYDYEGLFRAWRTFHELAGDVLGFEFDDGGGDVVDDVVEAVLDVREEMRTEGEYEVADDLRDALEASGVEVRDTDEGPTYRMD